MLTRAGIVVVCFVLTCTSTNGQATRTDEGIPQTTVGQYGHFSDLVLPGGPWRAKVVTDDRTPIMLRIISTFPHGDSFRYELQYYGLAPGTYERELNSSALQTGIYWARLQTGGLTETRKMLRLR